MKCAQRTGFGKTLANTGGCPCSQPIARNGLSAIATVAFWRSIAALLLYLACYKQAYIQFSGSFA